MKKKGIWKREKGEKRLINNIIIKTQKKIAGGQRKVNGRWGKKMMGYDRNV